MIYIDELRCTGCGSCLGLCPQGAIAIENGVATIASTLCNECRDCLDSCPQGAIILAEPVPATAIQSWPDPISPISEQDAQSGPSVRQLLVPAAQAALLWAGREVLPRLAELALDWFDRQQVQRTPAHSAIGEPDRASFISLKGSRAQQGRRRRKHHRRRGSGRSDQR